MWTFDLEKITNYDDWKNNLRDHLKRDRIQGITSAFLGRLQGIENFYWQLVSERDLENGDGVQLDGIGEIIKEPRGQKIDKIYRIFLRGVILANLSHGKADMIQAVVNIFEDAYGATMSGYSEEEPAALRIELYGWGTAGYYFPYLHDTLSVIARSIGAGIRLLFQYEELAETTVFQLSETYGTTGTYDYNKGAGSKKYTLGGRIAGAILKG